VIAQFATANIGAILVNINPAYRVRELEYALRQSGCSTLIIAPPFKTSDYASLLRDVCPELDASEPGNLRAERLPDLSTIIAFGDQSAPGTYSWPDVLTAGESVTPDRLASLQREQAFDDPINIQYTSGTRGYIVMLGYWGNPEATAEAIDAGGWMHTGDLATMDANGHVNIVGRAKDMIIRGGENIYPREIEEFLYGHPKIREVQVIGVPDEHYGEEVMAWVILHPGQVASPEELRAHCQGQIAHYKIPRHWRFVDAFPMTVTGKIQKYKMREQAIEEFNWAATVVTA
jgi:acyl-CoA synthetase (AMP-forming)/AMP-acid ligase II